MSEPDPHFIGWLPMPRAFARFLLPVAVGAVVGLAVVAGVVASRQRSPGDGRWDDHATTLVGVAYADPYPMIRVPGDGPTDAPRTVLLVGEGKVGARGRVAPHDGRPVRVRGTLLERAGWRMLELADAPESLAPADVPEADQVRLRRSAPQPIGRVSLRGEIVDAKCYLGAMKPGDGRTHRGCAVLCLRGGVPPLFVSRSGGTGPVIHLVTDDARGPADGTVLDLAGVPISVDATVERLDDILVIRLARRDTRAE